jgi:hypothetical protein
MLKAVGADRVPRGALRAPLPRLGRNRPRPGGRHAPPAPQLSTAYLHLSPRSADCRARIVDT